MSVSESRQFWHDHLRQSFAKNLAHRATQRAILDELSLRILSDYDQECQHISLAIALCSSSTKGLLSKVAAHNKTRLILTQAWRHASQNDIPYETVITSSTHRYRKQLEELLEIQNTSCIEEVNGAPNSQQENLIPVFDQRMNDLRESVNNKGVLTGNRQSWSSIPEDEVAQRVMKGEVLHRYDQYIPGISKGKKPLKLMEYSSHVSFAGEIKAAALLSVKKQNWEDALTKYTQGVRLLESVTGENSEKSQNLTELLLTFHKNRALAALNTNRWNETCEAATAALEIDEHDGKARYRRGQAYALMGDVENAKKDFAFIVKSAFTDQSSKTAATKRIIEIKESMGKWKSDIFDIMTKTTTQETFSANRIGASTFEAKRDNRCEGPTPWLSGRGGIACNTNNKSVTNAVKVSPPRLSKEETFDLLEGILEVYSSNEVKGKMREIYKLADYDERRVLIRLRKLLPDIIGPTLNKFGIMEGSFEDNKKVMDKCISHWSMKDDKIRSLSKTVYNVVLGDINGET